MSDKKPKKKRVKHVIALEQHQREMLRQRALRNSMIFPHALRDAIPGALPGCGRSLILSSIDGISSQTPFGGRVRLSFHVEETGKLTGEFDVHADLNLDAARALAATLSELVARLEPACPQ